MTAPSKTPAHVKKVGPKAIAMIKGYEDCRLEAYMPTPNDVPTIGWGETGPDIKLGMKWTQKQCDQRFEQRLATLAVQVEDAIGGAPTTAAQFGALVSLAYNIGIGNFRGSSVLRNHKLGHHATAALAFSLWNKQKNKKTGKLEVVNGLTARRAKEAAFYRGEIK